MGKEDELLDIYDAQLNHVGIAPRGEAHAKGLWHRTFHCWIVSGSGADRELLFQLRHHEKDTFPGLLDISSAGHLLAGEEAADGARELEEELGLAVPFEQLHDCGIVAEENFLQNGLIDREFFHVFMYRFDGPLHIYRVQQDEVAGLFRVNLQSFRELLHGRTDRVMANGAVLTPEGTLLGESRSVTMADFVPHSTHYYERVLQAAEKL
ncbi:NUDIX hydrolase [Paenibacillus hamazuiensis]|uniref:NUDIX hydrolase n=1 Tax=Paenibacillus hamazuiensis TaxID=2936508 RepID=UPI00200E5C68|nr:NUDIX domain-containing protein [Paenibacillus hamazuiensis]